jgi:hypothetical protein
MKLVAKYQYTHVAHVLTINPEPINALIAVRFFVTTVLLPTSFHHMPKITLLQNSLKIPYLQLSFASPICRLIQALAISAMGTVSAVQIHHCYVTSIGMNWTCTVQTVRFLSAQNARYKIIQGTGCNAYQIANSGAKRC